MPPEPQVSSSAKTGRVIPSLGLFLHSSHLTMAYLISEIRQQRTMSSLFLGKTQEYWVLTMRTAQL